MMLKLTTIFFLLKPTSGRTASQNNPKTTARPTSAAGDEGVVRSGHTGCSPHSQQWLGGPRWVGESKKKNIKKMAWLSKVAEKEAQTMGHHLAILRPQNLASEKAVCIDVLARLASAGVVVAIENGISAPLAKTENQTRIIFVTS